MDKPEIHSAELQWHEYDAASVLNIDREEFEEWCREAPGELPEKAIIEERDIADIYGAFELVAYVARAQVTGNLTRKDFQDLDETLHKVFYETCLCPRLHALGSGDDVETAAWRPMMFWNIEHSGNAAFFPRHAVELFIEALETLCGRRRRYFGVCQAPSKDNPDESCGNLFLRERVNAMYCSDACRKRVQRGK